MLIIFSLISGIQDQNSQRRYLPTCSWVHYLGNFFFSFGNPNWALVFLDTMEETSQKEYCKLQCFSFLSECVYIQGTISSVSFLLGVELHHCNTRCNHHQYDSSLNLLDRCPSPVKFLSPLTDMYSQVNCSSRLKLFLQIGNSGFKEQGRCCKDCRNTRVGRWRDTAEPIQGCCSDSRNIFSTRTHQHQ